MSIKSITRVSHNEYRVSLEEGYGYRVFKSAATPYWTVYQNGQGQFSSSDLSRCFDWIVESVPYV